MEEMKSKVVRHLIIVFMKLAILLGATSNLGILGNVIHPSINIFSEKVDAPGVFFSDPYQSS